jgi:predicted DNA-binding WGR domain protein
MTCAVDFDLSGMSINAARPIQNCRWTLGCRSPILLSMSLCPFHLHCHRTDPSRNMARFFTLSIEQTLFGETAVVRSWGRIGKRGREKTGGFSDELAAASHFLELKVKDTPEREARNPGPARPSRSPPPGRSPSRRQRR